MIPKPLIHTPLLLWLRRSSWPLTDRGPKPGGGGGRQKRAPTLPNAAPRPSQMAQDHFYGRATTPGTGPGPPLARKLAIDRQMAPYGAKTYAPPGGRMGQKRVQMCSFHGPGGFKNILDNFWGPKLATSVLHKAHGRGNNIFSLCSHLRGSRITLGGKHSDVFCWTVGGA